MCIYRNKIIRGGGIHRLKKNLAGIKVEVEPCTKEFVDVQYKMKQSLVGRVKQEKKD
jgi:hypothetical protein